MEKQERKQEPKREPQAKEEVKANPKVVEAGKKSDAQTVAMASGKANVMDVVTAVAETDVAVSTLVSVRDRVIQAYEDIMRMPI